MASRAIFRWLAPCPFTGATQTPPIDLVTVARHSRPAALRFAAGLLLALGCRESAKPGDAAVAPPPPGDTSERAIVPPAEVVIPRPSKGYVVAPVAAPGTISGTVTIGTPLEPRPPVPTGPDSAVCGAAIPDESVVRQGNAVGGVVVWLEGIRTGKPLPSERRLELESLKCRLTPRVQAGVVGSAVNVIGHDDFRQHLRFLAGGERQPRAGVLRGRDDQVIPTELPFTAPGLVLVRDTDHQWPRAYIAVFDHPYFAVTAPNGTFTIDGVPPGKYTVMAWHERTARAEQGVEVTAGGTASVAIGLVAK
jgi:hypothetical protein